MADGTTSNINMLQQAANEQAGDDAHSAETNLPRDVYIDGPGEQDKLREIQTYTGPKGEHSAKVIKLAARQAELETNHVKEEARKLEAALEDPLAYSQQLSAEYIMRNRGYAA